MKAYQATDDQCSSLCIVVLARSDEIELLIQAPIAVLHRDRDKVLPEVTSGRINEQALSIGSLQRNFGECPRSSSIELMRLSSSTRLENTPSTRDGNRGCGIGGRDVVWGGGSRGR